MVKPRIVVEPPGPKTQEIVRRDHRALMRTTKTTPVAAASARGWTVEDVDGNTFLDFTSGIGVLNTGHSHPKVVQAIKEQAERLVHFAGTDFYYDAQVSYAEELARVAPVEAPSKVFYTNSGTESNEAALKIVRHRTGRPCLLAFLGGFHGRTVGALSLTASKPVQRQRFQPLMAGVFHVPYPDPYRNPWNIDGYVEPHELTNRVLDSIEALFRTMLPPQDLAACFAEAVQGEGGYVVPPSDFLMRLKRLLDDHGAALVVDEVQSGFGRTGRMFACEHFNVQPHVLTLAKSIASGIPLGAVVAREEYDFPTSGAHSNTYGGNLVAMAAARATLQVLTQEGLVENAAKVGQQLRKQLEELQSKEQAVGDVRGLGLMLAIDLVKDRLHRTPDPELRNRVLEAAFKRGLLLLPCGQSAIRLIPPLGIDAESVEAGIEVLEAAFKAVA